LRALHFGDATRLERLVFDIVKPRRVGGRDRVRDLESLTVQLGCTGQSQVLGDCTGLRPVVAPGPSAETDLWLQIAVG